MRLFKTIAMIGLAGCLHAEEVGTNSLTTNATSVPATEISWESFRTNLWGEDALPYAHLALKAWYQEQDPKKKEAIGDTVLDLANRAENGDIAYELLTGKPLEHSELVVPTNAIPMNLEVLKEWDISEHQYDIHFYDDVVRRVGLSNFELWTPTNGWLFDAQGKQVNEATVHRRDGSGREWYGAFLPDGQWITTELWGEDNRIYQFSKSGKFVNSFHVGMARWARASESGKDWVVGMNEGYGDTFFDKDADLKISPWGWKQRFYRLLKKCHLPVKESSCRSVEKIADAREFVSPRELGCRGFFCDMKAQSDDRNSVVGFEAAGHGRWCFWIHYQMKSPLSDWGHCIPQKNYENFGFFPGSLTTWIGETKYPHRPEHDGETFRSWIIDPNGKVLGWVPAERVADDPDGHRMWFVDARGYLLKVDADGVVSEVLHPTLPGASGNEAPFPHVLFPDLKLGFFYTKPGHLVLARWN